MPVTSTTFVRTSIVLLLIGLLTLLGIVVMSLWLATRTTGYSDAVLDVQQIRRSAFKVVDLVQDAETGQRGFLLTHEEPYLEPYLAALAAMEGELALLERVTSGAAEYASAVARINSQIRQKMAELGRTVDLGRSGRFDEALATVRTDRGKVLMDEIRQASDALIARIDSRLNASASEMRSSAASLIWVLVGGGCIILLVVGGSMWIAWRYSADIEQARGEVVALNATLEERVRERTSDLARANEEIQRFAYIVSHDLRSPLVNIMGFTSELEVGLATVRDYLERQLSVDEKPEGRSAQLAVESEMPEAIGFIRSSTHKMDNLINAILKLSREGRRLLSPERVDMGKLFQNAADAVQHQIGEAGGEIEVVKPVPALVSDRLALEQVFGNLLDNATKYLERGRPGRIVLRGKEVRTGVIYEVEDNGRGISKEDYERVFELFRRAGAQDKPGEGIGLSHVRALVRRLGGEIELESVVGTGTTFRVRLPRNMPVLRESA